MMDIHQILKQLPHRYPILLVDRVVELVKGERFDRARAQTLVDEKTQAARAAAPT